MTGVRTAKALFWLGIVIMVVGVITNVYTLIHTIDVHAVGYNAGAFVISIFSPLWQGGLLIGVAKIIEILSYKHN
jgi:hypothetical protein